MSGIRELSIRELTSLEDYFFVPVYQRAFSWTTLEIRQLIIDIKDTYKQDKPYYIGSLVVYKRKDGKGEVIDGQQRLTALSILLSVLKNEFGFSSLPMLFIKYEARLDAEICRDKIHNGDVSEDNSFSRAYKVFHQELSDVEDIKRLVSFLLSYVTLLEVTVPEDIDLNLYFEAMNRHSFQLLRSDILRHKGEAVLSDPKDKKIFNLVFEACSHFDRYVEEGMSFKLWNRMFYGEGHSPLFGVDYKAWWKMIRGHVEEEERKEVYSLDEIIRYESCEDYDEPICLSSPDIHYSITDYANFLLICADVLGYNFTLDDKTMLSSFDEVDFFKDEEAIKCFTYNLLRLRYLFDRYIIKESEKGTFALLQYLDLHEYRPSFKNLEATEACEKLLRTLSMKYPSHEHLYYLVPLLKYLNENPELDGEAYLSFLESFSKDWL